MADKKELRVWAEAVKARDGGKCTKCGSTDRLHAHHVLPKSKHPDKALDLNNGATLCHSCHAREHEHDFPRVVANLLKNKFEPRKRPPKPALPKPTPAPALDGPALKATLKELGWTQEQFAIRIDVHQNTVTRWTTGATAVPKIVAEYLRVVQRVAQFAADAIG